MVKVVILGGGFGGVRVALDLEKKLTRSTSSGQVKAEIILIDKNSYHLFVPDLYEIATSYGLKKDPFAVQLRKTVCIPYTEIFAGKKIKYLQREMTGMDLKNKLVRIGEELIRYDYLVIGLGSEAEDFNIPGVKEYAYKFRTLDDALMINNRLEELFKELKDGEKDNAFSISICGAGFIGVELAAELSCCSRAIQKRCKFGGRCSTITLFEAENKILPMISEKERQIIIKRLTKLGVLIMENSLIEEVGPDFIRLKNGQKIRSDMIIWNTGVRAPVNLKDVDDLPLGKRGAILVNNNLQVQGYSDVFAVGDTTEFIDQKTQRPIPRLAYVAVDQGKVAAKNIYAVINNKKLRSYNPAYSTWVTPVGGKYAVANLWGRVRITNGFLGWIVREVIDLSYLLSIFPLIKALKLFWDEITIFSKND